jgi:hypothetical protein
MKMCLTKVHCENHKEPQNYKGKLLIIKPQVLEPPFRQKETQYFFAQNGFGCDPNSLGTAVFGHFLANGQKARLERSDFLGIADKSQLPVWAANRLELLEKPSMKIRVFQLREASPLTFMNFEESSLSAAHRIRSSVPSVKTMVFLLAFRLSISLSNIPILIYLQI